MYCTVHSQLYTHTCSFLLSFLPSRVFSCLLLSSSPPLLQVLAMKKDLAKIALMQPVCTQPEEKIALSRRVDKHWR